MKVSVVIPAYNCAPYVADAVRSVTGQTESDIEVIVVDDGSTDDTLSIVQELARHDSRICIITQANSGTPSVGRNKGIRAAQGGFITLLDADDIYCPNKIERELYAFTRYPDLDVVFGDVAWFHHDPLTENNSGQLQKLGLVNLAAVCLEHVEGNLYRCKPEFYNFMSAKISAVNTQTVMIRSAVLKQEATFFREDWRVGEDIDLWFRLARNAKLGYLNELLSYYRQRPGSLMRDDEHVLVGSIRAHGVNLERGGDVLSSDEMKMIKSRLALQHIHLGYLYFTQGRMGEARASYRRAREFSPTHYSYVSMWKTWLPYPLVKLLRKIFSPIRSAEVA